MRIVVLIVVLSVCCATAMATEACAHRGDTKAAPENTLPAIRSAVEKHAAQIEFDLHLTKDGRLVVIHDATVDRTTNGKGRVAEMTFDEIRALDAGSKFDPKFAGTPIPTFREVLDIIPHDILCNVHLKDAPGVAKAAAQTLLDTGHLDHCFLACTAEQAAEAKTIAPNVRICNMSRQGGDDAYADLTIQLGTEFIQLAGMTNNLKSLVDKLHARHIKVNYFAANTEDKIRQCVAAGVDYILTDDLDLCIKVVKER